MKSDLLRVNVAILLLIVNDVASLPHPSVSNAERNNNNRQFVIEKHGGASVTGSVKNNNTYVKGQTKIQSEAGKKQLYQREGDDSLTGSVEINDKDIQGHINLPSDNEKQHEADNVYESGIITGSVELDDKDIQGHINIPSDSNKQQHADGGIIDGSVELDDKHIQGHINIPSDSNKQQHADGGIIDGSVELDDKDIQGHINIPSDSDKQQHADGGIIDGSVELDDKNIQGHINIPSDNENQQHENVHKNDVITGSVEIDDKKIEGHINIPSDVENNQHAGGVHEDDALTGTLEFDDENIQDDINQPSESNNQQNADGGTISGSVEIDDKNVEGHVNLPNDSENQQGSNDVHEGDVITGTVEIDDENIQGHIDIPTDIDDQQHAGDVHEDDVITGTLEIDDENSQEDVNPHSENEEQQNANDVHEGGAISGSVEIGDKNIEGHINLPSEDDNKNVSADDDDEPVNEKPHSKNHALSDKSCWMNLKSTRYLDALDKLDEKYSKVRQQYQDEVAPEFDNKMMEVLLNSGGVAPRALNQAQGDVNKIPAGINLGGYCMMRMPESLLFFHRMKLRNSTQFRVNFLSTQLGDMTLLARLSLNDIHLRGAYERSTTEKDPSVLYYIPSFGELDILLKNVVYKMEGHLRMLDNRLIIELMNSDLLTNEILLTYVNDTSPSSSIKLQPRNLEDFLERLKADLDFWLKDYFNDYLMYFGIIKSEKNAEIQTYEKQKTIKVNEYADYTIKAIQQRLKNLGAVTVKLPSFSIMSVLNNQITLKSGRLRGLDSIYRRSVATTKRDKNIRQIDFMVGFSKLKVEYQYEGKVSSSMPPLTGMLVLSADELVAHIELSQLVGSDTFDLNFDSIVQTRPESLTVEGPANRLIADFKHILEHPIIAIMSNIMKHNLKMLKSLTRCVPFLKGAEKSIRNNAKKSDNEIPADNANDKDPYGAPKDFGDEDIPFPQVESSVPEEHEENNKEWSDYVFSKNDSVELEVPVNGEMQKMKLDRKEKFVISKLP